MTTISYAEKKIKMFFKLDKDLKSTYMYPTFISSTLLMIARRHSKA